MIQRKKEAYLFQPLKTNTNEELEVKYFTSNKRFFEIEILHIISLADARPPIYSSEDDASDIEDRKVKKQERPKALQDSDDDDKAGGSGTTKVRVVSSSDDDDSD